MIFILTILIKTPNRNTNELVKTCPGSQKQDVVGLGFKYRSQSGCKAWYLTYSPRIISAVI